MTAAAPKFGRIWLGKAIRMNTVGAKRLPIFQIRVTANKFDTFQKQYYPKDIDYWCLDTQRQTSLADMVIIREMQRPLSREVQHEIDQIVQKHGDIVDPITKRHAQMNDDATTFFKEHHTLRAQNINKALTGQVYFAADAYRNTNSNSNNLNSVDSQTDSDNEQSS